MRIFQTIAGWFSGWCNANSEYFEITDNLYLVNPQVKGISRNKFIERLLDEIQSLNNDKVRLQSELRQVKAELAGALEDNKTGQAFFAAVMEEDNKINDKTDDKTTKQRICELVRLQQQLEKGKDESLANAKKMFGKTRL